MMTRKIAKVAMMAAAGMLTTGSLSAGTLTWTGAASSNWNLTDVNWTNELGEATAWVNGSDALFPAAATSPVSVTAGVQLRNLRLAKRSNAFAWADGGGSLTFVSDEANPTNYITFDGDGFHHELFARVNCEAPLVKGGNSVLYLHNPANSFVGGIIQSKSQLRIVTSGAVGPGPVTMLGSSTVFNHDGPVVPDVKFIQSSSSGENQLGSVGPMLTIKSVGTTADNETRSFRIGRGSGSCDIVLSLTDPESEGIGQYILNGSSSTFAFDGGVVKAAPETKDLFFITQGNATPAARVTNNGVTFDTAGASTELGLSLTFDRPYLVTNVVQTVYPANWSFESSFGSDWTVDKGSNTATSSSQSNDSVFMNDSSGTHQDAYCTTNESHFAVVRNRHTISQTVNLPAAGLWRVVYERGCRPHNSYYGCEFEVTVTLGDAANATVSPAQGTQYVFRREETALFALEAGDVVLSLAVSPSDRDSKINEGVLLDAVRLERCEVTQIPFGPFVKTGDGMLVVTNLLTEGLIAVSNGTLVAKKTVMDGPSVDVADGGTFALCATRLTNATVTVASGGTLSLISDNFVMNGSFEEDVLDDPSIAKRYALYVSGTGPKRWTFSRKTGATETSGLQANGSDISNKGGGMSTEFGKQTAYIRASSELRQTVTVPVAGEYEVSFVHACRLGYDSYKIPLALLIDNVEVASNGTRTVNYGFERCTARVSLTAGEHTLKFSTGNSSVEYAALLIDDVRLMPVEGTNMLDGNALVFASGATLDLQNVEPICLVGGVTVDGIPVKGSANALRRAGVTVTGTGSIQIGPPQGTVLIVR